MQASSVKSVLLVQPFAHRFGHHWPVTRSLRDALLAEGVKVDVVVFAEPVQEDRTGPRLFPAAAGVRAGWVRRMARFFGQGFETLACLMLVTRLCRRELHDVVHFIDGAHLPVLSWLLLHRTAGLYTLWGGPGELVAPQGSWLKRLRQRLTHVLFRRNARTGRFAAICETEGVRVGWEPFLGEHIHVVPYAVQPIARRANRQTARQKIGLDTDDPVFLLFGTHRKGKEYLEVFEGAQHPSLKGEPWLLFVGKVISGNDPRRMAKETGYPKVRIIDQFVPTESVADYFFAADAVLLPYAPGYVKGSGVLVESCRYARPVIAAGVGYLKDFVEAHGVGFVYSPGDSADLALQMERVTQLTEGQQAALAERLRSVVEEFSWSAVVRRYMTLYGQYKGGATVQTQRL